MRSTRVLYVENDAALRQFLSDSLADHPEIEIIASLATADEALNRALVRKADVALIDYALDRNGLNGIELGVALRNINEYIGIVIYSQFDVKNMVARVPVSMRHGWSFFEKSGEMTKDQYVHVIKDTATSKGNWENFFYSKAENTDTDTDINKYFALTPRQRSIITLLAQGIAVQEISHRLNMKYPYVRKELSRAYSVLLPDATEGEDLKTLAILKYLELMEYR